MGHNATILSGASLSDAVNLGTSGEIIGFVMPATWDAADLTFQASEDGSTFNNLFDDNDAEFVVQAAQARFVGLRQEQANVLKRIKHLKVRSGTAGGAVAQTANRTVVIVIRDK